MLPSLCMRCCQVCTVWDLADWSELLIVNAKTFQQSWVQSQHPPTQGNREGRQMKQCLTKYLKNLKIPLTTTFVCQREIDLKLNNMYMYDSVFDSKWTLTVFKIIWKSFVRKVMCEESRDKLPNILFKKSAHFLKEEKSFLHKWLWFPSPS